MSAEIVWTECTRHSWIASLGGEHVATVRRPIPLRWRDRGWSVSEVLGRHCFGATAHGDDLDGAQREAEALVHGRVARLAEALGIAEVEGLRAVAVAAWALQNAPTGAGCREHGDPAPFCKKCTAASRAHDALDAALSQVSRG